MDKYMDTNGIRLHYLDHPGEGPTLVLMPGLTANAHSFDGLIDEGLSPRLHVLALDLRGRGLSDKPDRGYAMGDHAADVIGLLDRLGHEKVVLGGHSYGGLLTYYMAAHFPDRVEKCVVLDAPAVVEETTLEQIKPSLDRLGQVYPSWEAYLETVKAMPYYSGWWDSRIEAYYRADVEENPDGSVRARSDPAHIQAAVEGTMGIDRMEMVRRISQPTLLLRATDPFGPPGYPPILTEDKARLTIGALRNGRLVEIPGNHMTFIFGRSAKLVADAIVSFVLEG